jgi:hypothetical protein
MHVYKIYCQGRAMRKQLQILSVMMISSVMMSAVGFGEEKKCDCDEVQGMPTLQKAALSTAMDKIAVKASEISPEQKAKMESYCLTFKQIKKEFVGYTLKEMEATPFPVDQYFQIPQCQADSYSNVVKSPLLHMIADDPPEREPFLKKIYSYYERKNQVATFTQALNMKNTKGETLLDYIEWINVNKLKTEPDQQEALNKIITYACSKGAVYSYYKNKACPANI